MSRLDELQLEAYRQGRYAETSDKVNLMLRIHDKPCIGEPCDDCHECKRHAQDDRLHFRWWRRYRT